jgi:hypothetical protein
MVIATTLAAGLAGMSASAPKLSWGPSASSSKLPRVRLSPEEPGAMLLTAPNLGARTMLTSRLPEPPGFYIENGPRLVILRPDVRMTNDRRGAFFGLRGVF